MSSNALGRSVLATAFVLGLMTVVWVGAGFVGSSGIALAMTVAIGGVYVLGAFEVRRFRAATSSLAAALADVPQPLPTLGDWLGRVHPALQNAVRLRIEGERVALPGLALTPYLIGLLVMLGMLGTFLGMVVTFKGAVFALEASADLQAIRSVLAEPIKGLALAFGTSVAGVATSAMLGLMSAISRRERMDVARQLDSQIAAVFRPFSLVHQRQETFKALQLQAHALPDVAQQLQALMEQMERRNQQLNEQLLSRQEQFHRDVSVAYTGLARSVEQSLNDSLSASARAAGESIKPVVESAMTAIAQESRHTHERVSEAVQTQLIGLSDRFGAAAGTVADTWAAALQNHARTSEQLVNGLDRTLASFTSTFELRCADLLASVQQAVSRAQTEQALADQQKQAAWMQALESTTLTVESGITRLLAQSEELVRSRVDSEARWVRQHGERMDQLAALWRTELGALRGEEAARGEAAVERLGELQAALASHLATLGAALENPLNRLLQTASEVPQAAAGVIAQLRQEMSRLAERDNLGLQERATLMQGIGALLQSVGQATGEQRAAIQSLVASATAVLDQVGRQFSETLGAQTARAEDAAAQVAGSAIELASLGEAFHHGVQLFSASHEKLIDSLQRMEGAIGQSMARSDEQLAYYVAQAREVIDLSISAQQGIVEDLRRLHGRPAALAEAVA
jgi:hypothetical protein